MRPVPLEQMAATVTTQPELLTIREVAAVLKLSPRQVRRLIALGKLPAVRLGDPGASVRVDRAELEAWLYANRRRKHDPAGAPRSALLVSDAAVLAALSREIRWQVARVPSLP
jgi:excisionase family DNA binding protein